MQPNVHGSTVYNTQGMEATQMSTDRGMDEEDAESVYVCIYTHTHT